MTPLPRDPKLWLDAALLADLRGEPPPPAPTEPQEALRERADADPLARAWLDALAERARQADRVRRALEAEAARVLLPDGSALSMDEAERTLAHKEETRAHASLRGFVDEACGKSLRFDEFRSDNRALSLEIAREFLANTVGARDAAREILETLAHEPLEGPRSLARALDLPAADGSFSGEAALALVSSAKKCLKTPLRPIRRVRVPRRLAGATLEKPASVLFGTTEPVLRLFRHERSVSGGVRSMLFAQQDADQAAPWGTLGLALGLHASAARRRVLAASKASAERAERAITAAALLEARVAAALWLAHGDPPHEDADREAVATALGADAGRVFLRERAEAVTPEDVQERIGAAAAALTLRDAFDEAYAERPLAWQLVRELKAPSAAEAARAWAALVVERA